MNKNVTDNIDYNEVFTNLFLVLVLHFTTGVVGKPAHFTVETKGAGVDSLGFAIEGPSQAEIKCVDKGDGICEVTYFPTQPGKYAVHVTCGDDDIQNSPFMVPISPPGDASLCYAEGPGLEPEGVVTGVMNTYILCFICFTVTVLMMLSQQNCYSITSAKAGKIWALHFHSVKLVKKIFQQIIFWPITFEVFVTD